MKSIQHILSTITQNIYDRPLIFYLLLSAVILWPLTFLVYSVQYDMLDVVLPWRYYAAECFQNGYFPLWNPYQQGGYPIYADLQYPIWYPEIFFMSVLFGYSAVTINLLLVFYIGIAGLGMYKLAREFNINYHYALLAGTVFMLSGIFIGHAQSLVSILGATWLPWVMAYYLKLLKQPSFNINIILKLVLVTFLMLTGGYQAVSFMLFYVLIALLILTTFTLLKRKQYTWLKNLLLSHMTVTGMLFILIAGMLLSVYQVYPFLERFHGLSLESAQSFIFHPKSLISLFLPFASVTNVPEGTDISMTNGFISSIILVFAVFALHKKIPGQLMLLIIFGVIFLLASFGPYTPVGSIFYRYIPLFDLFKYPVFYRYFFFIPVILIACYYFSNHITEKKQHRNMLLYVIGGMSMVYLALAIYGFNNIHPANSVFVQGIPEMVKNIRKFDFHEAVFLQSLFQSGLLLIFGFILFYKRAHLHNILFILILIEMAAAALINSPVTVYAPHNPKEIKENIDRYPDGFFVPDKVPIAKNADQLNIIDILWRNLGNYTKQPSFDSFSSFDLRGRKTLDEKFPVLRDSVLMNPVAYLSSDIRPLSIINKDRLKLNRQTIYVQDRVYENHVYQTNSSAGKEKINLTAFNPKQIICEIETSSPQWLVLLQSDFPGWQVTINNKPVEHYTVNHLFMGVPIPDGKHKLTFTFKRPWIVTGFFVSMTGFVLLLFLILLFNHPHRKKRWIILFSILLLVLVVVHFHNLNQQNQRKKRREQVYDQTNGILKQWDKNQFLYLRNTQSGSDTVIDGSRFTADDITYLGNYLHANHFDSLTYIRLNSYETATLPATIHDFYPKINTEEFTQNLTVLNAVKQNENQSHSGIIHDIDSSQLYSLDKTIRPTEIAGYKNRILYYSGMIRGDIENPVFAVMEIKRPYRNNTYRTIDLKNQIHEKGSWNYFILASYLTAYINDHAEIKFYLWNPEKQNFSIKSVKSGSLILNEK